MKKKYIISFCFMLCVCSGLFSQVLEDSELSSALMFSNIKHTSDGLKDDIKWIIQIIYGNRNTEYQNRLLESVISSIDNDYIYKCIKANIIDQSLDVFLSSYNNYHKTETYKFINSLENRDISESETKQYTFENEKSDRQELLKKLVKDFNFNKYQLMYLDGLALLIIYVDNNISTDNKEKIYSKLHDLLNEKLLSSESEQDNLNYYSACYHDLDNETLSDYIKYFSTEEVNKFYYSIYYGLYKGLTEKVKIKTGT
jgi:hypothetical protein